MSTMSKICNPVVTVIVTALVFGTAFVVWRRKFSGSDDSVDSDQNRLDKFIAGFDKWWKKENESPNGDVFLPRKIKKFWEESDPDMSDRVRAFLDEHPDLDSDFDNMEYGEDYVFALHGSQHWEAIQKSGLKSGRGVCGTGVYFALSAGVCKNVRTIKPLLRYEFTTLKYGCRALQFNTTGLVVALVLNPKVNPGFCHFGDVYQSKNWAMARELDVLPLKIATASTEKLIQLLWDNYGDQEHANETRLFSIFKNTHGEFDPEKVKMLFEQRRQARRARRQARRAGRRRRGRPRPRLRRLASLQGETHSSTSNYIRR